MKNIRSTLVWSTPNLFPPDLVFGCRQIEKQILSLLDESWCVLLPFLTKSSFTWAFSSQWYKKDFFLSSVWIPSKCLSFFSLPLKNKKGPSAENYSLTSFECLPNTVSSLKSLCFLYFPVGNGLESHIPLKCPVNSFSLFRALSQVLCKLPHPTP